MQSDTSLLTSDISTLISRPYRNNFDEITSKLIELDASAPPPQTTPETLSLSTILVRPELFQPRDGSLAFRPQASKAHVAKMISALRAGQLLDPLLVISFGDRWFLVDGHHRLKAYHDYGKVTRVPVRALSSDKRGVERVYWAIGQSVSANAKDKLSMTGSDKFDAAWRLTTLGYSKASTASQTGVADGTIAKMRRVRRAILEAPKSDPRWAYLASNHQLYGMSWRCAQETALRISDDLAADHDRATDWREMNMRKLTKSLTGLLSDTTDLTLLVDALEAVRPGITEELHTLLNERSGILASDIPTDPNPFDFPF